MKDREELQEEIEYARRKLDEAFAAGDDEDACYLLSRALDKLLEEYIDLGEYERETELVR